MSRLTKKDISGNYDLTYENGDFVRGIMPNEKILGEIYINGMNKLGKLEDLEDELGCPLEVVFKALLNGIWLSNGIYEFIHDLEIGDFGLDTISNCIFNYSENDYVFLKDYKKTWWLKEDLSE